MANFSRLAFRMAAYSGASCLLAMAGPAVAADEVEFNESFLSKGGAPVELKYFEKGSAVAPGSYDVDIYLNQTLVKRQDILFKANDKGQVRPVITRELLTQMGADMVKLEKEGRLPADGDPSMPMDIDNLVPGASVDFDVNGLALQVSLPQAYVHRTSRGYVDPSLWDRGITAFFIDYQTNFNRNTSDNVSRNYGYVGLRNGFNVNGWRFRNESALTTGTGRDRKFTSNRTFVERDVASLKGKLSVGELYTQGDIFDSVRFRGAQLNSDLGMLPDNEVGYAPVVRGIAETNATVEVRQNGYVIYSTSVSPGAFEISDIYPSGSNGDLTIKIIESDGRQREYAQSYAYLPVMTRRGNLRYSFAAGEYHYDGRPSTTFAQGTAVYGLSDNFTGYGGVLGAEKYSAVNLGVGVNSAIGGFSFDITHSQSKDRQRRSLSGDSARFLYAKTLTATDTTFTMVGYRYSTDGYRTFGQHIEDLRYSEANFYGRQKNRVDMTVNQALPGRGSLYLSIGESTYWNRDGRTRNWQVGYSGSLASASYSVAMSRTQGQGAYWRSDTQFNASISIPLGSPSRSHRLYANAVSSRHGDTMLQSGVSGYLDDRSTVSYSASASHSDDYGSSGSVGLGWDTPIAKLSGNYSQGRDDKHVDVSAAGSIVVHGGGITLGQPLGETFALVEVPKVRGVGVEGWNGLRTDRNGYAVVPYAQPYRYNWVNLDTATLGSDTEVSENAMMLVPTRGAIVKANYAAQTGRRVQFDLKLEDGKQVPFGAQAIDAEGKTIGMVDNLSRLLVFGVPDSGRLKVQWSEGVCAVDYQLPAQNKGLAYERMELTCRAFGAAQQP